MKLTVTTLLLLGFVTANVSAQENGKTSKPKRNFTISKKTTYVTGPVTKDGYIDYAAALNKRLSEGVTPANNANVLLLQALGPHPDGAKMPAEFFEWMGVKPPPQKGDYYVGLYEFVKQQGKIPLPQQVNKLFNRQVRASRRPWTEKQYPHIAEWLKANEKPLALVVQATKRTHYFSPLTPTKSKDSSASLMSVLFPAVQKSRDFATAFSSRAMLRLSQGRYEHAWQDLLACHRLGRHVAKGATLIEGLVGIAIDQVAVQADVVFLARAKLNSEQIKKCLHDLQQLWPMPMMADKMDLAERFIMLDCIMLLDQKGVKKLKLMEELAGGAPFKVPNKIPKDVFKNVNWDPALVNANRWYDRFAAAMRAPKRSLREMHLDRIENELRMLKKELLDSGKLIKILNKPRKPQAVGKVIGDYFITLLMPAVRKVQSAADRTEQIQRNLHIAFALEAYRRDHQTYPNKLQILSPKYMAKIPNDHFSGKALKYNPSKDGYQLYSVGVNGKDDNGRWSDDHPRGDDPNVRMPLPAMKDS